jgi:hypothetical protein
MSRQHPLPPPDGGPHPYRKGTPPNAASPGRPGQAHSEKPEKQSFLMWISTTAGVISAVCGVIALLVGTVVAVKVINPSPKSSPTIPQSSPDYTNTDSPTPSPQRSSRFLSSAQLENLLLPSGTFGSAASGSSGTDPSQIVTICDDARPAAVAVAYENITNSQTGIAFTEILTVWPSVSAASQAVEVNTQGVDQGGTCDVTTTNDVTQQYEGDYPGSPPTDCVDPGQYLATAVSESSPSSSLYQGFLVIAQCGINTVAVQITQDLPGMSLQIANGYLSRATGELESAAS